MIAPSKSILKVSDERRKVNTKSRYNFSFFISIKSRAKLALIFYYCKFICGNYFRSFFIHRLHSFHDIRYFIHNLLCNCISRLKLGNFMNPEQIILFMETSAKQYASIEAKINFTLIFLYPIKDTIKKKFNKKKTMQWYNQERSKGPGATLVPGIEDIA